VEKIKTAPASMKKSLLALLYKIMAKIASLTGNSQSYTKYASQYRRLTGEAAPLFNPLFNSKK
jgi:hypothetical protein